jgi:putative phosphoesterase
MEAGDKNFTIGVVSDTHGKLARRLGDILAGVDLIIHAGDVDRPEILESLQSMAPVVAVRGNMDQGNWARTLSKTELVDIEKNLFYVVHNLDDMDIDPESLGVAAVISGHTHRAKIQRKGTVLFLNPGSATLPRGKSSPSMALIYIRKESLDAQFFEIEEREGG